MVQATTYMNTHSLRANWLSNVLMRRMGHYVIQHTRLANLSTDQQPNGPNLPRQQQQH
jgi:hypothetical protein